jgi:uncharacterized protein (DUF2342 family)
MALTKNDKKEMVALISDAINDVVVPALEKMEERLNENLASKEDVQDLASKVVSLDRKFDAQQDRQDRHNTRIKELEKIHPKNTHLTVI